MYNVVRLHESRCGNFNVCTSAAYLARFDNTVIFFENLFTDRYQEIERQLIDSFRRAYFDGDLQRMRSITGILSNFKVMLYVTLLANIIILVSFHEKLCGDQILFAFGYCCGPLLELSIPMVVETV
jgi:hypothetical protein